jgi:hypothetical protein
MGETVYKFFQAATRALPAIPETGNDGSPPAGPVEGLVEAIISTGSIDRDNEAVSPLAMAEALPAFVNRGILIARHDYQANLFAQIGDVLGGTVIDGNTVARLRYYVNDGNQEADWGYKLATKYGKAAYSIGFVPIKWVDAEPGAGGPRRTFTQIELLEVSHVLVPSNREALVTGRSKGLDREIAALAEEVFNMADTKPKDALTLALESYRSASMNLRDALTAREKSILTALTAHLDEVSKWQSGAGSSASEPHSDSTPEPNGRPLSQILSDLIGG